MIDFSKLRPVCYGRVAFDIIEDSPYIEAYTVEWHPDKEGDIFDNLDITQKSKDTSGSITDNTVSKTTKVKAKWLPWGDTNRVEPPTVCKGEDVLLFQYSDLDQYYWLPLHNELKYRKLEKRTIILSNKRNVDPNISEEDLYSQAYFITMDTINKVIRLHTADNDGEYTTYDVEINTKDGILTVVDGKENSIELDSTIDKLTITTNEDIESNTTNHTRNIGELNQTNTKNEESNIDENKHTTIGSHYQIDLKSYAVDNGSDELIQVLCDFAQACSDQIGVGNLGKPVANNGATKASFSSIKGRLSGFKK